jgi:hypothetical protein
VVQGLVLAGALLRGEAGIWLPFWTVTVLPVGVSLLLLLWPRAFPAQLKAVLYLWHLLCLLVLPFQSGQTGLFTQMEIGWGEALTAGMLLAFLVLHGLFAVRFFIITLSLLRRRNRPLVAEAMQNLFYDEQTPLLRSLLVAGLLGILLWANQISGYLDLSLALGMCSLLAIQLMGVQKPDKQD